MNRLGAEIKHVVHTPHEWDVHVVTVLTSGATSVEAIRDASVEVEVHPVVALATHVEDGCGFLTDVVRAMIWDTDGPTRRPWLVDAEDKYDPQFNSQVIGVFRVGEQPTPEQIEEAADLARANIWHSVLRRREAA